MADRSGRFRPGPQHERVVVLTGAGMSARAGLPLFRGESGLWALEPDLEASMHASALPGSLPQLWETWGAVANTALAAGPTPGHRAIARLGYDVITQNVDGLHQAAGTETVAELHGSALRARCMDDRCDYACEVRPGSGRGASDHGVPDSCPVCGAPMRPDVVLFEEMLPAADVELAERLIQQADLFVVAGTSGNVYPAASFAPAAKRWGAETVLIDIDPVGSFAASGAFDHVITADAHEILPDWERGANGSRNPFLDPFG